MVSHHFHYYYRHKCAQSLEIEEPLTFESAEHLSSLIKIVDLGILSESLTSG